MARSARIPTAEQLFSNGPHLATNAFEIGDSELGLESSLGVDLGVRRSAGRLTGELSVFVNRFDDFIFEAFTGEVEDGLDVIRHTQADALFTGAEAHVDVELLHRAPHHLALEIKGDLVRAELADTDQPLPRIPPARLGAGIHYQGHTLWGGLEVHRVFEQDRVADFEDPTGGYTMAGVTLGYRFFLAGLVHDLIVRGTNLTDEVARNHVSFLKELAPLPGRDLSLAYRLSF